MHYAKKNMKKRKRNLNKGSGKSKVIILLALVIIVSIVGVVAYYQSQKTEIVYDPPVTYNQEAQQKLVAMLYESKPALSESDQAVKDTFSQMENPISQTEQYTMRFEPEMDQIVVEILSSDVAGAKDQAVTWLKSQGLSDEGICTFPVEFILNDGAAEFLRGQNLEISPLADGC